MRNLNKNRTELDSKATLEDKTKVIGEIKSRQRVEEHGEVFTPDWLVDAMLDLVKDESKRIDSRFLEPACGSGNFLVKVICQHLF